MICEKYTILITKKDISIMNSIHTPERIFTVSKRQSYKKLRKKSVARRVQISTHIRPLKYAQTGLTKKEFRKLSSLTTPIKIQSFLDSLQMNFEEKGETYMSPQYVLRHNKAHCLEGALIACLALWINGQRPYLLDLKSETGDDHIIVPYKVGSYWGAISKTNHATLRFRDPVYTSIRELAVSYFHEYFDLKNGKKILRSFSDVFDMSLWDISHVSDITGIESRNRSKNRRFMKIYRKKQMYEWINTSVDLSQLADDIDASRHTSFVPRKMLSYLRKADAVEIKASHIVEWDVKKGRMV